MFGSEIIDVVIGMIFVFLVLSLICSAANEIIEAWLNKRADYLEKGISELLTDRDGGGYLKELYRHPLIAGLYRDRYGEEETGWRQNLSPRLIGILNELGFKKTRLPSYIPAQNFSLALMDIVLDTSAATSPTASPGSKIVLAPPARSVSPSGVMNALPTVSDAAKNETIKALRALVKAADGNPARVRENIENWYNSSMDRVSGWYKRRTQVIILLIGSALTVFLNADSIAISKSLSTDRALRSSLAASAAEYARADAVNAKPESAPPSVPAAKNSPKPPAPEKAPSGACGEDPNSPRCKMDADIAKIKSLGLPIGWDGGNPALVPPFDDVGAWFLKFLGWALTAFAITLGAPFWFDLLNKFMVVRATVKPKEKSPEEPSKA